MKRSSLRTATKLFAVAAMAVAVSVPVGVRAQGAAMDPAAIEILQRMTDYLGSLEQFSVQTRTDLEELLDSGQRIDVVVSASVTVNRPNMLRAERKGELVDQMFYYDGKTLTLYNPTDKVYGTEPAPGTVEEMLDFARESLGIMIPAADLVYRNAYPLLMQDVTSALVVGKTVIGGVRCDHLAFRRPGVDFQVCVADGDEPLPYMYVVTDTSTPALVSVSTVMSDWNVAPAGANFSFTPPEGAAAIAFMPLAVSSGSNP